MRITQERKLLLQQGLTRTMTGSELFHRYYFILEEIAKELQDSHLKEVSLSANKILLKTKDDITLNYSFGDVGMLSQWLILPETEKYEKQVIDCILNHISKEKEEFTFFDIGANIGWYSFSVGKKYPACKVYSFEPAPKSYEQILINSRLNNLTNITPVNIGFAESPGEKEFFFCEEIQTASSLADTLQNTAKKKILCKFDTVNNFCKIHCSYPDFIKCDVEGAEYLVIQGALETIQQHKPVLMLEMLRKWMRCFHVHPNDVINELKNIGYKCYSVSPQTALLTHVPFVDENTSETNFFFLHTEAHSNILDCLTEEKKI